MYNIIYAIVIKSGVSENPTNPDFGFWLLNLKIHTSKFKIRNPDNRIYGFQYPSF